jgi:small subunit ribosomal protein S1
MEKMIEETKNSEKEDLMKPPKIGEIIKGKIIGQGRASVFLDLGVFGTGIIFGKEFHEAKNELKNLKTGDDIFTKVVDLENEEGYIELSLSKAGKEIAWEEIAQKKEDDETIKIKIVGANKGGLLAEVSGISAFLPVSQLSSANYPKVEGGDSQKILKSLQNFIGEEMEVKIFDFDKKEEKLILSEKAKQNKKIKEILDKYEAGDVVEGEVTGVVDFGAFVKFSSPQSNKEDEATELEGLIHISELDWQLIEDPSEVIKIGQKVKAKIIDISNGKVSLSLKALKEDPWKNIEEKYKKGDIVKGEVTKFNPFGAFIKITDEIQGLCHVSEFSSHKKMEDTLKIGEQHDFQIVTIEPSEHRMSLKLREK